MAGRLGIDVNAVRKHLDSLESIAAVRPEFRRMGAGRPRKLYHLTPAGLELFPRRYDLFLSRFLDDLLQKEGKAYVGRVLARVAQEVAAEMDLPADGSSSERLEALVEALGAMGFQARLEAEGGCPCIVNSNCIALRVASRYPGLVCRKFHSTLISTALEGAQVKLKGCIVEGDPVCRHVVALASGFGDQKVSKIHKLQRPP